MKTRTTALGSPGRGAVGAGSTAYPRSSVPTALADIALVLVATAALPLWIALLLGYAVLVLARQLYWWARGNTTATSRVHDSTSGAGGAGAAPRAYADWPIDRSEPLAIGRAGPG